MLDECLFVDMSSVLADKTLVKSSIHLLYTMAISKDLQEISVLKQTLRAGKNISPPSTYNAFTGREGGMGGGGGW